MKTQKFNVH